MPVSPLSPLPALGFAITLPDAVTVVEATTAPFNNTAEILIWNFSANDDRIFIQFVNLNDPPTLPAAGAVIATNSMILAAGTGLTLSVGPEGNRQQVGTVADWVASEGANIGLVFKAESDGGGAGFEVGITYVQNVGGFTP